MSELDQRRKQAIRERAYFIWEREGRPEGRAQDHWRYATIEESGEERVKAMNLWKMRKRF